MSQHGCFYMEWAGIQKRNLGFRESLSFIRDTNHVRLAMKEDIISIFQGYKHTSTLLHREMLSLSFKAYMKTCHFLQKKLLASKAT